MNYDFATLGDFVITLHDEEPEEAGPEIPPPVWDDRPIDGARCMAATKALCG